MRGWIFFFLFVCFRLRNDDSADLKTLDNRGEMDTWFRKKFILVRPFPREISLKFAVSKHRSIGYGYKGWKISFRPRSIQRSVLHALYTHTHIYRKRSNKDTSNGSGTRRDPKGDLNYPFFIFQSKKT